MSGFQIMNKAQYIVKNCPTKYKAGAYGNYSNGYWEFDDIGLLKAILWGWNEKQAEANGGATAGSNGFANKTTDLFYNDYCTVKSTDINMDMPCGCVLHKPGHVGIYLGFGKVVEVTNDYWFGKVVKTNLISGGWEEYGKLANIAYGGSGDVNNDGILNDADIILSLIHICGAGGNWTIQIIDDDGQVKSSAVVSAAERKNRRDGKTIIPLGI